MDKGVINIVGGQGADRPTFNSQRSTFNLQPSESVGGNSQKVVVKPSTADDETIRRKYVFKKIKFDTGSESRFNKRSILVGAIALALMSVGVFVVPKIISSGISRYKPDPDMTAKWTLDTLARALGRYRFHVGAYPTNEEGLNVLAYYQPEELAKIQRAHPGWKGPYIDCVDKDPWGGEYVYEARKDGDCPILYSCGPDRKAGTADDLWPHQALFDEQSWDTSWAKSWRPVKHRGAFFAPMQRGVPKAFPEEDDSKNLPERQPKAVSEKTTQKSRRPAKHRGDVIVPMQQGVPKLSSEEGGSKDLPEHQPKAVCEKTMQNGIKTSCPPDESEDLGDLSDIMKIPLLVGLITFVVSWLLLRMIFPTPRKGDKA